MFNGDDTLGCSPFFNSTLIMSLRHCLNVLVMQCTCNELDKWFSCACNAPVMSLRHGFNVIVMHL